MQSFTADAPPGGDFGTTSKEGRERLFLEGLSSAHCGLAIEACPYLEAPSTTGEVTGRLLASIVWKEGWAFGRFVAVQKLRKDKAKEIRGAIAKLRADQPVYTEMCRIVNAGVWRSGANYFRAKKGLDQLVNHIRASEEHALLLTANIQLHLPCRPSEEPYLLTFWDRQFLPFGWRDVGDTMRKLVQTYGDRHGVRAAWETYCYSDEIEGVGIPR